MEVLEVSTDVGLKVNISIANCLLGQSNKISVCKTAWDGCILTDGSMQVCEHCAKSKTKQKNTQKIRIPDMALVKGERLYLDLSQQRVRTISQKFQQSIERTGRSWCAKQLERNGVTLL